MAFDAACLDSSFGLSVMRKYMMDGSFCHRIDFDKEGCMWMIETDLRKSVVLSAPHSIPSLFLGPWIETESFQIFRFLFISFPDRLSVSFIRIPSRQGFDFFNISRRT